MLFFWYQMEGFREENQLRKVESFPVGMYAEEHWAEMTLALCCSFQVQKWCFVFRPTLHFHIQIKMLVLQMVAGTAMEKVIFLISSHIYLLHYIYNYLVRCSIASFKKIWTLDSTWIRKPSCTCSYYEMLMLISEFLSGDCLRQLVKLVNIHFCPECFTYKMKTDRIWTRQLRSFKIGRKVSNINPSSIIEILDGLIEKYVNMLLFCFWVKMLNNGHKSVFAEHHYVTLKVTFDLLDKNVIKSLFSICETFGFNFVTVRLWIRERLINWSDD